MTEKKQAPAAIRPYVEKLCENGHRGTATAEEEQAARWMKEKLESLGLETSIQRFRTPRTFGGIVLIHILTALFGTILIPCCPFFALLFLLLATLSFYGEFMGRWHWLSRALPMGVSQNVIGRHRPANPKRTIIVSGHLDSAQTGLIWHPGLAAKAAGSSLPLGPLFPLFLSMATLLLVAFIAFFGGGGFLLSLLDWIAAISLVVGAALMLDWMRGEAVPGANDNASGIAAAVVLAEKLLAAPPEDTELYFIGFGAEEANLQGSVAFLKEFGYRFVPESTYVLNIDGIASGKVHYITREVGLLPVAYPDQEMIILARTLARASERFNHIRPVQAKGFTDALPFALEGFKALSLVGLEENEIPKNYHTLADTVEAMDWRDADTGVQFAEAVIAALRI